MSPDEARNARGRFSIGLRKNLPTPGITELFYGLAGSILLLHYAWLLEDAYVYFRYVDNWVLLGRGLVYNPGEFAEGYTSPAWTLLLSALRVTKIGFWPIVQGIGLLCFLLFWYAAVTINRGFSRDEPLDAGRALNLPLAFLCLNYGFLCYFTSGTESPLVPLVAGAYVLFALRPESRPLQIALAFLPLIRPELALALLGALVWCWYRNRRPPIAMAAAAFLVGGGWLAFRIVYYADLFPTTYYLKNVTHVIQGLRYVHDSFGPYHLYELFGAAIATLGLVSWRSGAAGWRLDVRGFLCLIALLQIAYTVSIGGDARHFRYLAFPITLLVLAGAGIPERLLARTPRGSWATKLAPIAALCVAALSFSLWPRQLDRHPAFALGAKPHGVDMIADAAHHRLHPAIVVPKAWTLGSEIELLPRYEAWLASNPEEPPRRTHVNRLCHAHYERFDHWAIHGFGLTDPFLARITAPVDRPAHKPTLRARAREIERVIRWWGRPPGVGMFRGAIDAGVAAAWMKHELATLELVERKAYNRHDPLENLRLALHFRERIDPEAGAP